MHALKYGLYVHWDTNVVEHTCAMWQPFLFSDICQIWVLCSFVLGWLLWLVMWHIYVYTSSIYIFGICAIETQFGGYIYFSTYLAIMKYVFQLVVQKSRNVWSIHSQCNSHICSVIYAKYMYSDTGHGGLILNTIKTITPQYIWTDTIG